MQPPILRLFFHDPPPPSDAITISGRGSTQALQVLHVLVCEDVIEKSITGSTICRDEMFQ